MNTRQPPAHAEIRGFGTVGHCLTIADIPLTELAESVGGTPFYAYDSGLITRRIDHLRRCLPNEVKLHYAVKANPMPEVVRLLTELVDGLDVASVGEMRLALEAGMPAAEVSFAGPGKTVAELTQAVAAGIVVMLESPGEMERLHGIAREAGKRPKVAVRVNPDFELKASGMKMGGGPKPFGIDAEQVPEILLRLAELDLEFHGFHIFSGSQNLQAEALIEAQRKTLDLAAALARHAPERPRFVNIGGGFGIPYFPGDQHLDIEKVGEHLAARLDRLADELAATDIVIELGRYIVGEAGIYVCRVVDTKLSRGRKFLITDGGLHHHLALSGNFGQVLRKNYPVAIANKMDLPADEVVDIVGCLCTPLDRLGDKVLLPRSGTGDLVVVFQSGAYGLTASPTGFLSHPPPREVLV